jgi:signal transduction histidine kinase
VRLDGTPFAATYGAVLGPLTSADNLLHDARFYESGDVWVDEDGLLHVAAGPILRNDLPLAILVAGRKLDATTVAGIEALLQQRVAVLAGDDVVAADSSTARALADAALIRTATLAPGASGRTQSSEPAGRSPGAGNAAVSRPALAPMAEVQTFALGEEEFLGLTAPIVNADREPVANILAFRSLDTALEPARELRLTLLAVASAGVAVAFLLGLVLARSVTAPVNRLIDDAQRLGSGDLDRPIVASRSDEIGHLAEGFDRMRVSLKKAQEELVRGERLSAIGQMASSLVHDFSNPLVSIRLNADVLEMESLSDENQSAVRGIKASVERLNQMMRELLDFVSGKVSIDRNSVQVGAWLDDIERFWTPNLASMRVAFRVEAGYRDGWAFDPTRMRRVIDNLVKNAQSVLRAGGTITVRTARDPNGLRIEVSDTGPGIPLELRETLFQPFVTFGKKEGTGLGLAICKNLVDRHGGVIDFTSTSGGTTFAIVIPWVPARELQEASA